MATYTENLKLKKPELGDDVSPLPFNDNSDILDAAITSLNDTTSSLSETVSEISDGINNVANTKFEKGKTYQLSFTCVGINWNPGSKQCIVIVSMPFYCDNCSISINNINIAQLGDVSGFSVTKRGSGLWVEGKYAMSGGSQFSAFPGTGNLTVTFNN